MSNSNNHFFDTFVNDFFCYRNISNMFNQSLDFNLDIYEKCIKILNSDNANLIDINSPLYLNNQYIHLAIIHSSNPNLKFVSDIVASLLQRDTPNTPITSTELEFLLKALEKDISVELKSEIIKKHNIDFFNKIASYGYDTKEYQSCQFFKNNEQLRLCPYSEETLQLACSIFSQTKYLQKTWLHSPFRLIKDNEFAHRQIDKFFDNECIQTSIVNNSYLSNQNRFDALHNSNFKEVYFATEEIKNEIYKLLVAQYTEGVITPLNLKDKTYSKQEISTFKETRNLLKEMLINDFFTESQQLDLANRLINLHSGKVEDEVLSTLFLKTKHESVFNLVYKLPTKHILKAHNNNKIEPNIKLGFIKKITSNPKSFKNSEKIHIIEKSISKTVLDDESYSNILKNGDIVLLTYLTESPHTPDWVLEKIIKGITITNDFRKIELDNFLETQAMLNKILKPIISHSNFEETLRLIEQFKPELVQAGDIDKIFSKLVFNETNTSKCDIDFYKYLNFVNKIDILPLELIDRSIVALQNYQNLNNVTRNEKQILGEVISIFSHFKKIYNSIDNNDFEWCSLSFLHCLKKDFLHKFNNEISTDPLSLINNFDSVFNKYCAVQKQIEIKEKMVSKENSHKIKNSHSRY